MKFKKFLGAVCSFLLATTSFLCGDPASAKTHSGKNFCVFMVNSGEDLGNGECDGDKYDKACLDTITKYTESKLIKGYGCQTTICDRIYYKYLMLNQKCPTVEKAIEDMTILAVPDVFVVVANLAKNSDEVIADINKHFDQILKCQKNGVLYSGSIFSHFNKEVYPDTVPMSIYGVVPEGMEQKTLNKEFVEIVKQIKLDRQGNGAGDGKFKNILNKVYVRQSNGTHTCINMDNNSEIGDVDFYRGIKAIAEDESLQPILWPNYHDVELRRREEAEAEAIFKAITENEEKRLAEERRNAEAKRKDKEIVGITLVVLGAALAIGSAIFGIRKGNQNKNKNKNQRKTQVPKTQVQKSQVTANA